MSGDIIAFGTQAVTIQDQNGAQYYAKYEELDLHVINDIMDGALPIPVLFEIDKTRHAGKNNKKYRYYATDVRLVHLIYL